MTDETAKPILYLKQNCPFCLKLKLFALEAGLQDELSVREFAPGDAEETAIRAELDSKVEKVTFPTAQLQPGEYMTDSDGIVDALAARYDRDLSKLPVFQSYVSGAFKKMMEFFKECQELKAAKT